MFQQNEEVTGAKDNCKVNIDPKIDNAIINKVGENIKELQK